MDISKLIKDAINALPDGDYQRSLTAVTSHIDVAIGHLQQAQTTKQTHLFTDAIYRCNQAYEGSIKEAYRVLAGQDPGKKTTSQIESYLERNKVLKPRVLEQLRRYRREWRNPATHDHTEDFDEGEAFLAIVNIVAFAKVCIDQIAQKIAFDAAQATERKPKKQATTEMADLAEVISLFGEQFFEEEVVNIPWSQENMSEAEIAAAIGGFLSNIPGAVVSLDKPLGETHRHKADIYVQYEDDAAIVELKSLKSHNSLGQSIISIDRLLDINPSAGGVIILYDLEKRHYSTYDLGPSLAGARRLLLAPTLDAFDAFESVSRESDSDSPA
jgi:hypothetical protein